MLLWLFDSAARKERREERKEPERVAPSQVPFLRDAGPAYTFEAGGK